MLSALFLVNYSGVNIFAKVQNIIVVLLIGSLAGVFSNFFRTALAGVFSNFFRTASAVKALNLNS